MSDITAWVTRSCADLGLVVSSPGERTHDQPWSVAVAHDIHLPTAPTVGLVQGQRDRHPSRARADLGPGLVVPDLVPEVLAIDAERAWSLTRDVGPTWRSAVAFANHWSLWEDLLGGIPRRSCLTRRATYVAATIRAAPTASCTSGLRPSDRLTASGRPQVCSQLANNRCPPWVRTLSGWNCTPSRGRVR